MPTVAPAVRAPWRGRGGVPINGSYSKTIDALLQGRIGFFTVIDELSHDDACALLEDGTSTESLARDVERACVEVGIIGVRLASHRVDFDVPVPLVLEVDACSHLVLYDKRGHEVGRLYVDVGGEAYGRSYKVKLRLVSGEERVTMLEWPVCLSVEACALWANGIALLERLLGAPLSDVELRGVLCAAVPPPLRRVLERALADLPPSRIV